MHPSDISRRLCIHSRYRGAPAGKPSKLLTRAMVRDCLNAPAPPARALTPQCSARHVSLARQCCLAQHKTIARRRKEAIRRKIGSTASPPLHLFTTRSSSSFIHAGRAKTTQHILCPVQEGSSFSKTRQQDELKRSRVCRMTPRGCKGREK